MEPNSSSDPILAAVEGFLATSGMTPTAFGQKAVNDPTLVHGLRRGRECRRATCQRILTFIEQSKRAAPSPSDRRVA